MATLGVVPTTHKRRSVFVKHQNLFGSCHCPRLHVTESGTSIQSPATQPDKFAGGSNPADGGGARLSSIIKRRMTMHAQQAEGGGTSVTASQLGLLPCKVRYHESPLSVRLFLVEGLLTQLCLPLVMVYHLIGNKNLQCKNIKHLMLPLGTWWCFAPLLWSCAAGVVIGAVMLLSNPDWSKDVYLRQQSAGVNLVGIGEGALAISLWILAVVCSAISTSHKPLLLGEKKRLPFSDELRKSTMITTAAAAPTTSPAAPTISPGNPSLPVSPPFTSPITSPTLENSRTVTFEERNENPTITVVSDVEPESPIITITESSKKGDQYQKPGASAVTPPMEETPGSPSGQPSLEKPSSNTEQEHQHIPYDEVLFDEIPPIEDDVVLLYSCAEYFEANREMEPTLQEEEERVLNNITDQGAMGESPAPGSPPRSPQSKSLGGLAPVGGKTGGRFSHGQNQQHHKNDLGMSGILEREEKTFKFVIGEVVRRSAVEPDVEFIFGGDIGIADEGTAVEIASRKWGPGGVQLYSVDNSDPGVWSAMNDHFVGSGKSGHLETLDVAVGSEGFFSSLSRRGEMTRFDLKNGNYSSREGIPEPLHPISRLGIMTLCFLIAASPILVRWFTGQPMQGQGSVAEWMIVICSFVLTFLCTLSVSTVVRACRISLSNFAAVATAFSTVCFNTHRNRWFPLLNLLEPVNVEAWYFLRLHVVSVYPCAFQGRALMFIALAGFSISWGAYAMTYIALSPEILQVHFEGWILGALLFCVVSSFSTCKGLYHAAVVNFEFRRHLSYLSLTKVMTAEEMCAGSEVKRALVRSSADIATLIDAQAILADVMFVLGNTPDPIIPFGLSIDFGIWRFVCFTQLLVLVPIAFTVASAIQTGDRWMLPNSRILPNSTMLA